MSQVFFYLGRFALIVIGFLFAITAASVFLNVLLLGSSAWAGSEAPYYFTTVPAFAAIIGYSTFAPAAILIVYAELTAWRDWLFYALGGAGVAIFVIVWKWQPQTQDISILAAILATGVVGGFMYWLVAGRTAGLKASSSGKEQ